MVSSLGFGCSPLGGVFGRIDEKEGIRAVRTALDLGITFFDVAPFYGDTRAETVLGRALAGVPRESYVLATKVGRYGEHAFDFSAARTRRSVEESLGRLGVDHVDLLYCHDIEFASMSEVLDETLPALDALRRAGACRAIGVTGLPLATLSAAVERSVRVRIDAVLTYCHGCLSDSTIDGMASSITDRGIGLINASPLAMGLLTHAGPPPWHPAPEALRETCARAADHCLMGGADLAAIAMWFAHARPGVSSTISGMATAADVRRNIAAISTAPRSELLHGVMEILAPVLGLGWQSGRVAEAPQPMIAP